MVATVRECCEPHGIRPPTLVSESGRAIASHFSVLVFDVLGAGGVSEAVPPPAEAEALILRNLRDTHGAIAGDRPRRRRDGDNDGSGDDRAGWSGCRRPGTMPSSSRRTPSTPSGSAI